MLGFAFASRTAGTSFFCYVCRRVLQLLPAAVKGLRSWPFETVKTRRDVPFDSQAGLLPFDCHHWKVFPRLFCSSSILSPLEGVH